MSIFNKIFGSKAVDQGVVIEGSSESIVEPLSKRQKRRIRGRAKENS